jgi:hypothetical protein
MNTNFDKLSYKKNLFLLIISVLLINGSVIAQQNMGPFRTAPAPPNLFRIFQISTKNTEHAVSNSINMENTYPFDSDMNDGILLTFTISTNNMENMTELASFYDKDFGSGAIPVISVLYSSNNSLIIRRYYSDRTPYGSYHYYYDYKVFDQLFKRGGAYRIKLYMTANFIFVHVYDKNPYAIAPNYFSPIFFGLDIPNNQIMESFLDRSANAEIRVRADPVTDISLDVFYYNRNLGKDGSGKVIYGGLLPNIRGWIQNPSAY